MLDDVTSGVARVTRFGSVETKFSHLVASLAIELLSYLCQIRRCDGRAPVWGKAWSYTINNCRKYSTNKIKPEKKSNEITGLV